MNLPLLSKGKGTGKEPYLMSLAGNNFPVDLPLAKRKKCLRKDNFPPRFSTYNQNFSPKHCLENPTLYDHTPFQNQS